MELLTFIETKHTNWDNFENIFGNLEFTVLNNNIINAAPHYKE